MRDRSGVDLLRWCCKTLLGRSVFPRARWWSPDSGLFGDSYRGGLSVRHGGRDSMSRELSMADHV